MNYKIIACDLDDTLLDDFGKISQKNKESIEKLPIYGIKFLLVTGRTYKSVLPFYNELHLNTPIITSGGTQVFDSSGNMIFHDLLPKEKVKALLKYSVENGIHAQVYMGEDFQYLKSCEEADYYASYTKLKGVEDPDLLEKDIETSKVVFITDEQKAPEQIERIKNIFPELSVMRSKGRLIEVYTRHASKGNALKHIVEKMGFFKDEVVAVGDSTIDLSMLEYAALSAAPQSSLLEVKEKVDVILKDNNSSCVHELIERYVL